MQSNGSSATAEEMRVDPQRAKVLAENIAGIRQKIQAANTAQKNVRLIAVSKLKPVNDILALHSSPSHQLHFGENYSQELQQKAALLPPSIHWHFIGGLQTNKCKGLAESVPNLFCVSSVDTAKKADALDKGRAALLDGGEADAGALKVLVQVNTSGEPEKSGVEPGEAPALCRHIAERCPHLRLGGVMTIGAIARSQETTAETENEDFERLRDARDAVAKELGVAREELELSMGMSADFEGAIAQGSDEVRIGSDIFGERPMKKDAKITEGA